MNIVIRNVICFKDMIRIKYFLIKTSLTDALYEMIFFLAVQIYGIWNTRNIKGTDSFMNDFDVLLLCYLSSRIDIFTAFVIYSSCSDDKSLFSSNNSNARQFFPLINNFFKSLIHNPRVWLITKSLFLYRSLLFHCWKKMQ